MARQTQKPAKSKAGKNKKVQEKNPRSGGRELTDAELDKVSGGIGNTVGSPRGSAIQTGSQLLNSELNATGNN
jgi:hypothetical protein